MDNLLANIVGDVDSLEIDNLNDPLVRFCFIRSIDNQSNWVKILKKTFQDNLQNYYA
jgi:hypothetical protein